MVEPAQSSEAILNPIGTVCEHGDGLQSTVRAHKRTFKAEAPLSACLQYKAVQVLVHESANTKYASLKNFRIHCLIAVMVMGCGRRIQW